MIYYLQAVLLSMYISFVKKQTRKNRIVKIISEKQKALKFCLEKKKVCLAFSTNILSDMYKELRRVELSELVRHGLRVLYGRIVNGHASLTRGLLGRVVARDQRRLHRRRPTVDQLELLAHTDLHLAEVLHVGVALHETGQQGPSAQRLGDRRLDLVQLVHGGVVGNDAVSGQHGTEVVVVAQAQRQVEVVRLGGDLGQAEGAGAVLLPLVLPERGQRRVGVQVRPEGEQSRQHPLDRVEVERHGLVAELRSDLGLDRRPEAVHHPRGHVARHLACVRAREQARRGGPDLAQDEVVKVGALGPWLALVRAGAVGRPLTVSVTLSALSHAQAQTDEDEQLHVS
jgi:hypothetical protein